MTKIVKATVLKRTLVALGDFFLFVFAVLGIFAAGQNIANGTSYCASLREEISSYQLDSGLYYANERGEATPYDNLASYTAYETKLLYFYTEYLSQKSPISATTQYDVYWYNVHVLGLRDTKGIYSGDTILEPGLSLGPSLFEYSEAGVDSLGRTRSGLHIDGDLNKPLTESGSERLLNFYYSPASRNAYFNAGQALYYSSFYQKALNSYTNVTNVIPLATGIGISGLLLYFLFPMVLKDGSTLSKKAFGLCVIGAGGYKAKKTQILLRQLPPILAATALFFFVPFTFAVMIASLVLLASYLTSIFTPKSQAIHDFIAYTQVVDAKESFFYANDDEEKAAGASLDAAMKEADQILENGKQIIEKEEKEKALK